MCTKDVCVAEQSTKTFCGVLLQLLLGGQMNYNTILLFKISISTPIKYERHTTLLLCAMLCKCFTWMTLVNKGYTHVILASKLTSGLCVFAACCVQFIHLRSSSTRAFYVLSKCRAWQKSFLESNSHSSSVHHHCCKHPASQTFEYWNEGFWTYKLHIFISYFSK